MLPYHVDVVASTVACMWTGLELHAMIGNSFCVVLRGPAYMRPSRSIIGKSFPVGLGKIHMKLRLYESPHDKAQLVVCIGRDDTVYKTKKTKHANTNVLCVCGRVCRGPPHRLQQSLFRKPDHNGRRCRGRPTASTTDNQQRRNNLKQTITWQHKCMVCVLGCVAVAPLRPQRVSSDVNTTTSTYGGSH